MSQQLWDEMVAEAGEVLDASQSPCAVDCATIVWVDEQLAALRAENEALKKAEREKVELAEALRNLVTRLDFIHADPTYAGVWQISQLHFGPYTGPTYTAELDAARAALAAHKSCPTCGGTYVTSKEHCPECAGGEKN